MFNLNPIIFFCAGLLDLIIGDPHTWPHPVKGFGWVINKVEIYRQKINSSICLYFLGAIFAVIFVSLVMVSIWYVQNLSGCISFILKIILGAWMLAGRSLCDAILIIIDALESKDIKKARRALSFVVGRDTQFLSEKEIIRASIETTAEGLCDGVIAPLFWFAVGGLPMLWGFKVISTLDSMIGHMENPWRYFGFASAKLDDIANFLPARITVLLIALASKSTVAFHMAWRDGGKTNSPNAGYVEAAFAGALEIRLGGINYYDGVPNIGPYLGEPLNPLSVDILKKGLVLAKRINLLGIFFGTVLLILFDNHCVY